MGSSIARLSCPSLRSPSRSYVGDIEGVWSSPNPQFFWTQVQLIRKNKTDGHQHDYWVALSAGACLSSWVQYTSARFNPHDGLSSKADEAPWKILVKSNGPRSNNKGIHERKHGNAKSTYTIDRVDDSSSVRFADFSTQSQGHIAHCHDVLWVTATGMEYLRNSHTIQHSFTEAGDWANEQVFSKLCTDCSDSQLSLVRTKTGRQAALQKLTLTHGTTCDPGLVFLGLEQEESLRYLALNKAQERHRYLPETSLGI
jgi:hypothetical protein